VSDGQWKRLVPGSGNGVGLIQEVGMETAEGEIAVEDPYLDAASSG
jgi:hypothetical protein